MFQPPLPQDLAKLSIEAVHDEISQCRAKLGKKIVILGHHYQRDEVIRHADFTGDSLKLARIARDHQESRFIIFCGVHFMAETADILTSPLHEVSLPDLEAGCEMADMANIADVKAAWDEAVAEGIDGLVPITYVNSSAALKAFVGDHGGTICTSGNAAEVITWALAQGKHVFFFPDQHLGRNVSKALGLSPDDDMLLWDPKRFLGGHALEKLESSKIWLWKGHCPVHALFSLQQLEKIRAQDPAIQVIVHPECAMEVVDRSDYSGSTEFIINKITKAAPGSSWAVGTEKHLVERLAAQFPDKKIYSLNPFTCLCGTMNRISARHLLWVLRDLVDGKPLRNRIQVDEVTAKSARVALERMLKLS